MTQTQSKTDWGARMAAQFDARLNSEIENLLRYVERLRQEVAGATKPNEERKSSFHSMSEQLTAIAQSTEEASHVILESSETIAGYSDQLNEMVEDEAAKELCEKIASESMRAMEACSFQDLTGQRVTRILSSLRFVEDRVNAMVELCGQEAIEKMSQELADQEPEPEDVIMHGPQSPGASISQDEIDALFD